MDKDAREAREMFKNFSFKEKIAHFWYYYGKCTIVTIFALVVVAFCVTQCITQVHYDLHIAYYGCHSVNKEAVNSLADSLKPVIKDITGNGVTDILMSVSVADISGDTIDEMTEVILNKIPAEIAADEYQMYILDETYFEFFNTAYKGIAKSTVTLSDIPEVSEALGFREGEKVYLVMTIEFEQSKDDKLKIAERENAVLVEQYFKDMLK